MDAHHVTVPTVCASPLATIGPVPDSASPDSGQSYAQNGLATAANRRDEAPCSPLLPVLYCPIRIIVPLSHARARTAPANQAGSGCIQKNHVISPVTFSPVVISRPRPAVPVSFALILPLTFFFFFPLSRSAFCSPSPRSPHHPLHLSPFILPLDISIIL